MRGWFVRKLPSHAQKSSRIALVDAAGAEIVFGVLNGHGIAGGEFPRNQLAQPEGQRLRIGEAPPDMARGYRHRPTVKHPSIRGVKRAAYKRHNRSLTQPCKLPDRFIRARRLKARN